MINNIKRLLIQIGGPITINNTLKYSLLITNDLLKYHETKINEVINDNIMEYYNISDLYSLYFLLKFIVEFLGEEEFNTVTGLDLYDDGYKLLNQLKNKILDNK